jgi:serine protease Do
LLELADSQVTAVSALGPTASFITDLAMAADGNLILAAGDQGVFIMSAEGVVIDQPGTLVSDSPLPGELVMPVGVAVDATGSLYVADSDGTFGAITAMHSNVAPDRVGSASLIPGRAVQGALSAQATEQVWTYAATAGERITVTAIDNLGGALDLALRLLDSNSVEIAANDNHASLDILNPSDAQLVDVTLPAEGIYTILVEQMAGEGGYSLGLSLTQMLTLDATGSASASGELGMVLPVDTYEFSGATGQSLTITLEAIGGDLDPLLRLFGPDGGLVAENDDADDPALGTDSQIMNFTLSAAGLYRLEAARFEGAGRYRLTIAPAA